MNTEQLKAHMDRRLDRIESKVTTILQLVTEHLGDPITIQQMQERLNASQKALRELEYEQFFKNLTR